MKNGDIMPDKVEEFLNSYSPEVRDIAMKVRKLVTDLVPDAKEKVYGGWKTIGYSFSGGMKDVICAIGPHSSHVNLVFFRGSELADPQGQLEGTGKKGRHVKIKNVEYINSKSLENLIKSGVELVQAEK